MTQTTPRDQEPAEPESQQRVYTHPLPEESAEDFGRRVLAMVKQKAVQAPQPPD